MLTVESNLTIFSETQLYYMQAAMSNKDKEHELAEWLSQQKINYVCGRLSDNQIKELECMQFSVLPLSTDEEEDLRLSHVLDLLSPAEVKSVENKVPGFKWRSWDEYKDMLVSFQGEHGRLPRDGEIYNGMLLGNFLQAQREAFSIMKENEKK
jgi:hypothetical protein